MGRTTRKPTLYSGMGELIAGIRKVSDDEISPDRIQINTVVRPPNDPAALPLDSSRMKEIKTFLVGGLVEEGMLRRGEHAGEIFYYYRTESEQ